MEKFAQNYAYDIWGQNGPTLMFNALKTYCSLNDDDDSLFSKLMLNLDFKNNQSDICNNLVIYPESYFYPYRYIDGKYKDLFVKNIKLNSKLNETYSVHFYGSLSYRLKAKPDDNSVFIKLAAKNCVKTYEYCRKNRLFFE